MKRRELKMRTKMRLCRIKVRELSYYQSHLFIAFAEFIDNEPVHDDLLALYAGDLADISEDDDEDAVAQAARYEREAAGYEKAAAAEASRSTPQAGTSSWLRETVLNASSDLPVRELPRDWLGVRLLTDGKRRPDEEKEMSSSVIQRPVQSQRQPTDFFEKQPPRVKQQPKPLKIFKPRAKPVKVADTSALPVPGTWTRIQRRGLYHGQLALVLANASKDTETSLVVADEKLVKQMQENHEFNVQQQKQHHEVRLPPKLDIDVCKVVGFSRPMPAWEFPLVFPSCDDLIPFQISQSDVFNEVSFVGKCPALAEGERVLKSSGSGGGIPGYIALIRTIPQGAHLVRYALVVNRIPEPQDIDEVDPPPGVTGDIRQIGNLRRHVLDPALPIGPFDRVRVVAGTSHVGKSGRVSSVIEEDLVVVQCSDTEWIEVRLRYITRDFRHGDFVRVSRGAYKDRLGLIVGVRGGGFVDLYDVSVVVYIYGSNWLISFFFLAQEHGQTSDAPVKLVYIACLSKFTNLFGTIVESSLR